MKLLFFIRELNTHLAQGCEKLKEESQQAWKLPHASQESQQIGDNVHELRPHPVPCADCPTPRTVAAVSLTSSKCHSRCLSWFLNSVEKRILGNKVSCLALMCSSESYTLQND